MITSGYGEDLVLIVNFYKNSVNLFKNTIFYDHRHILIAPSLLDSYSGSVFPGLFDAIAIAKEKQNGPESDKYWNEVGVVKVVG